MSVDQVSGVAGGATGTGLGSVTGMLQGGVGNIVNMGGNFLDKILPPDKREEMKSKLVKFATEKPQLASFLLSQIALSGLPIFLFIILTITVVIFALLAGLLVGLLGAILFILIAVGFALAFLLPTLFFTTFAAVAVWLWGMGAYYILKWFNGKEVPGIHTPMADELKKATGLDNLTSGLSSSDSTSEPQTHKQAPPQEQKQHTNGAVEKQHSERPKKKSTGQLPQQVDNGVSRLTDQAKNTAPVAKPQSLSDPKKTLGF